MYSLRRNFQVYLRPAFLKEGFPPPRGIYPLPVVQFPGMNPLNILSLVSQGRAVFRAFLFVTQVLPLPMKPQQWMTAAPAREAVTFPLSSGQGEADVYRVPGGKRRAGLLFFMGINPAPRNDHRVVNLGYALARAGFVVMFPWSTSLMGKRDREY